MRVSCQEDVSHSCWPVAAGGWLGGGEGEFLGRYVSFGLEGCNLPPPPKIKLRMILKSNNVGIVWLGLALCRTEAQVQIIFTEPPYCQNSRVCSV